MRKGNRCVFSFLHGLQGKNGSRAVCSEMRTPFEAMLPSPAGTRTICQRVSLTRARVHAIDAAPSIELMRLHHAYVETSPMDPVPRSRRSLRWHPTWRRSSNGWRSLGAGGPLTASTPASWKRSLQAQRVSRGTRLCHESPSAPARWRKRHARAAACRQSLDSRGLAPVYPDQPPQA